METVVDDMLISELGELSVLEDNSDDIMEEESRKTIKSANPDKYCCKIIVAIQLLYILAAVMWILFLYWCGLINQNKPLLWLLIIIPLVVYAIGFYNACEITEDVEGDMLGSNYLSFGFLIVVILINWNTPKKHMSKSKFFKLLTVAFILIMLSMIDIWVDREKLSVVRHFKSILQTAALVTLSIALYLYYVNQRMLDDDGCEEGAVKIKPIE